MSSLHVVAVSLDAAQNISLVVVIGFVVLAILAAVLVPRLIVRLLLAIALVAVALAIWSQRANLRDCAEKARSEATNEGDQPGDCNFFGYEINVP